MLWFYDFETLNQSFLFKIEGEMVVCVCVHCVKGSGEVIRASGAGVAPVLLKMDCIG